MWIDTDRLTTIGIDVVEPGGFGAVQANDIVLANDFYLQLVPCACNYRSSPLVALEDNATRIGRYVVDCSRMVLVQAKWFCSFVDLDFEAGIHRNPVLIVVRPCYAVPSRYRHARIAEANKDSRIIVCGIVEPELKPKIEVAERLWKI